MAASSGLFEVDLFPPGRKRPSVRSAVQGTAGRGGRFRGLGFSQRADLLKFNVSFGKGDKIPRLQAINLVHFISVQPHHSVCDVMGQIKGKTSRNLLSENQELGKKF
jgi:hypothetical protein